MKKVFFIAAFFLFVAFGFAGFTVISGSSSSVTNLPAPLVDAPILSSPVTTDLPVEISASSDASPHLLSSSSSEEVTLKPAAVSLVPVQDKELDSTKSYEAVNQQFRPVVQTRQTFGRKSGVQTKDRVVLPMALQDSGPASNETAEQAAALENLQDKFVEAIGGENQKADDPLYRQRWISAQNKSDEEYRMLFGWEAFNTHQLETVNTAVPSQP